MGIEQGGIEAEPTSEDSLFNQLLAAAKELRLEPEEELIFDREGRTIDLDLTQRIVPFQREDIARLIQSVEELKERFGWIVAIEKPE